MVKSKNPRRFAQVFFYDAEGKPRLVKGDVAFDDENHETGTFDTWDGEISHSEPLEVKVSMGHKLGGFQKEGEYTFKLVV